MSHRICSGNGKHLAAARLRAKRDALAMHPDAPRSRQFIRRAVLLAAKRDVARLRAQRIAQRRTKGRAA